MKGREGACPRCGGPIRVTGGPARCGGCQAYGYFTAEGGRLVPVPPGTVDKGLGFTVFTSDLTPGARRLPWGGACCVCGAPSDRARGVQFADQLSGVPGVIGTVRSEDLSFPVCAAHEGGARSTGGGVAFQSYDYWLEYLRLNGRKP
ncbi:MAG: hypothetical protein KGL53_08325 [Elusimicrobia bacterium]|nr:hypothetical protein [Elusimicrobiota bacterium]